jgi:hypothetical protein
MAHPLKSLFTPALNILLNRLEVEVQLITRVNYFCKVKGKVVTVLN